MIDHTNPKAEISWTMACSPSRKFTISAELLVFCAAKAKTEAEFRTMIYTLGHVDYSRQSKVMAAGATA